MAVKRNKNGKWEVDFRDPDKKRIQKTFARKKDADEYFQNARVQVRRGQFDRESKDTIGDLADQWLGRKKATAGYRFGTIQNWERHINEYIKPELGDIPMQRATIKDCEDAALKWSAKTSGNTANMVLRTLTAIFALAQRHGTLQQNGTNVAAHAERIKI